MANVTNVYTRSIVVEVSLSLDELKMLQAGLKRMNIVYNEDDPYAQSFEYTKDVFPAFVENTIKEIEE